MDPKEYLSRYHDLGISISAKLAQLERLREQATEITQILSPVRVQTSRDQNKASDLVCQIINMEMEIGETIKSMEQARKEIEEAISKVENCTLRSILEYRYLAEMKWEKIAVTIDYDYRWVLRLHKKALKAIESHIPDDV